MKAAVWHQKGDIRIEDVPEPSPGPGQVKLKVKACGICGSDLHEYNQGPFIIPKRPHPLTGRHEGPVILGHEFSAEIAELGENIKGNLKPGDRVTVNPLIYCGECYYCKRGMLNMCTKLGTIGFAADGAFAEYMLVGEYAVHKLPEQITDEMGTFVEPLAVAVNAVNRSRLKIGDSVTIVGAGPIGLLVLQVCLAAGASKVFVVEPDQARRKLAGELGAEAVFDPREENAGKAVAELTDGLRSDIAFDCVGSQAAFDTAVKVTARRGRICVAGLSLEPIQVEFIRLWGHEKEITFSSGYEDEFPAAIALLADGRVSGELMITKRISLDDLVDKGILSLADADEGNIKILVYP